MRQLQWALPSIASVPVLLLWGADDQVVSPRSGLLSARVLSRRTSMSCCRSVGHLPYEEAPEEFNRQRAALSGVLGDWPQRHSCAAAWRSVIMTSRMSLRRQFVDCASRRRSRRLGPIPDRHLRTCAGVCIGVALHRFARGWRRTCHGGFRLLRSAAGGSGCGLPPFPIWRAAWWRAGFAMR